MNFYKEKLITTINRSIKLQKDLLRRLMEVPPDKTLGDFSLPCFELSKQFKKAPIDLANELKEKLKKQDFIDRVEANNGYLNFFLNKNKMSEFTLKNVLSKKNNYGKTNLGKNKKVMVEYSSPNTNKPLHLGHVRNDLLGMSISKILEFNGYKVIKSSVINDRGIHICKSMLAYLKWGDNKKPDQKPDHFVGSFYVLYSQKAKENPILEDEAQELLKKWESGDKKTIELWKKMNSWVYQGFKETYKMLGSKFDKVYYESKIYKKGKEIVLGKLKKGIFNKEDGAIIVNLSKFNLPNKILIRSDKTSLYITQDIYLAILKFKTFKLRKSVYVVGNEQNLHFKQLFAILNLLGFKWYKDCYHLSYGYVSLTSGRMKSREGTIVDADTLIENMTELAKIELEKRNKLKKTELERRAKIIALGAIKFFFLKYETFKDFVFDPKESISFEGETGPYVQYTYARSYSILKKHKGKINNFNTRLLEKEEEISLIKTIYNFPEATNEAVLNYKPSIISRYIIVLCQQFNEFYQKYPVLNVENNLKISRIALVLATNQVISNACKLLNIELLEKM